jgi:hypothetical protein
VSSEEDWTRAAVTVSPASSSSSTTSSSPDLTIKVGDTEMTVVIGSAAGVAALLAVAVVLILSWRFFFRGW